jgi:hypothetical protein
MFGMIVDEMALPQPTDGFAWAQGPGGVSLVCRALEPFAPHLFTTRAWILGGADDSQSVAGWSQVAERVGVDHAHLVRVHQVHGASVLVRRAGDPSNVADRPPADIILSNDPALALAVQTADCVPLLIADRRTGAVAAAHAGWRGLAGRVPQAAVEALRLEFGSRAADLVVAAGPSIGACCYEVGADVRAAFASAGFAGAELARWFLGDPNQAVANPSMRGLSPVRRENHWFFDGWAATRHQLEAIGVGPDQVHAAGLCTASHPDVLCSYRRDGKSAGRIAGVIKAAGEADR